jgi:excisionase family DNA binding protein
MLTIKEVCERTGFARATIYARIVSKKLPAVQEEDGTWRVSPLEVEKLLHRLAEPLYSAIEAAAFLSFSEEYIRKVLRRGEREGMACCPFPRAVKLFSEWRIPEGDLVRLIQLQRAEQTGELEALEREALGI